jgi:hypothetical protein
MSEPNYVIFTEKKIGDKFVYIIKHGNDLGGRFGDAVYENLEKDNRKNNLGQDICITGNESKSDTVFARKKAGETVWEFTDDIPKPLPIFERIPSTFTKTGVPKKM